MLSAVDVHEHKVPRVKEFDLSKLEKKLEEVHNAEAPVVNKEPEAPRKILKYQPLPNEKADVLPPKEVAPQVAQLEPQASEQKTKIAEAKPATAPTTAQAAPSAAALALAPASAPVAPVAAPTPSLAAPKAPVAAPEPAKPTTVAKAPVMPKEVTKAQPEAKQPELKQPQPKPPVTDTTQDVAQAKVVVKSIQFKGNNSLPTRELNSAVAQYIGQESGLGRGGVSQHSGAGRGL